MANQITVDILADTKNLVAGVNTANSQLANLGASVSKVSGAFRGLASVFGAQIGFSFLTDAIKGASDDEAAFKRLGDLFGKDIEAITAKVNSISAKFKVDDGAIADYFVQLKAAFSSQFDKFVPTVVEASATLALLTGKPLDEVISLWAKTLKDGKITAQEVQKLGIDLTSEQEQQFNKLKTSAEKLQFLLDIINSPENQKKALDNLTPYQKWQYVMEKMRDMVGNTLLPVLEKLTRWYDGLTPKQQDLTLKIAGFTAALLAVGAVVAPLAIALEAMIGIFVALRAATLAQAAATAIMNAALLINPFLPLIAAIALVVVAVVGLIKNWDTVVATFKRVGSAIAEGAGALRDGLASAFNSVKSWLAGLIGDFTRIGRDVINGLVSGIRSMASAPIDAIKGIGNGLVNTFKSFFRIGSPSKLFADYGKNIVQGLSNGIQGAEKLAISSMDAMSARIASPSFSFGGGGSAAGMNITINAGVGTDPYELGRVVKAALDKYNGVNGGR
jgi:hypothetical protein